MTQVGQPWTVQAVAVFAASLAGLITLLSPAVYARTHPGSGAASSAIRLRPRGWMILAAPLGGVAMASPRRCVGVGSGFPVPVVATVHGHHAVSQLAYVNDCARWTLLIFTATYLLWLAVHRRHPPVVGNAADVAVSQLAQ